MAIAPKDYFLDFEIADGGFEIWVNDIPYFKDASGGSVATEVLVNHFVHQGKNELRIKFFPLEAAGFKLTSYFKASIIARTNDEKSSNILVSVQFVFEAKEDQQSLPMVEQAGQFDIAELLFKPALWVGLSTGLSASQ
ncbi:MAG TPA: hypothetical protein PKD90_08815, partial [Phnomibacter sp.]|nr:hypothetical protein [Phnomibacter sp.]